MKTSRIVYDLSFCKVSIQGYSSAPVEDLMMAFESASYLIPSLSVETMTVTQTRKVRVTTKPEKILGGE